MLVLAQKNLWGPHLLGSWKTCKLHHRGCKNERIWALDTPWTLSGPPQTLPSIHMRPLRTSIDALLDDRRRSWRVLGGLCCSLRPPIALLKWSHVGFGPNAKHPRKPHAPSGDLHRPSPGRSLLFWKAPRWSFLVLKAPQRTLKVVSRWFWPQKISGSRTFWGLGKHANYTTGVPKMREIRALDTHEPSQDLHRPGTRD